MKRARLIGGLLTLTVVAGGSAAGATISGAPRCSAQALRVDVASQGATQSTVTMVTVRLRHGTRVCRLRGVLRIDLTPVRRVNGNPARLRLDAMLAPGSSIGRDWAWRNWCGPQRAARAVVTIGGARAHVRESAPVCNTTRHGSTLTRFG